MDAVLPRERNYIQIFMASLAPLPVVLFMGAQAEGLGAFMPIVILVVMLASFVFWFKNGTKPSAWIKAGTLYIRDGAFSEIRIPSNKVQSMRYESHHSQYISKGRTGETVPMHKLFVKMQGFQEWEIPIKDMVELGAELRLYKFIKDNFYDVVLAKKP
ncbi:hypothetical protein AN214_04313 [Pseudoalteromonas sp. P1-9]|uniref:hypothetical protein n=1 Tax=Pseudoalteromonas sp. P1-9 TaxID=1710354 RepID=UPI0006D5EFAA|nr:hypothetical protein [Pseudoalteromonas sp. P1-9]KPV93647.1 hypothetical protein AN214_04313 [Pseudoalteromonas sp. P1-9]